MRPLFAIIPAILFLALATSHCVRSGVQLDDAGYIALRVADNVRHGHGIVFNPGERRDLVDSPVWLGILTVLSVSEQAPLLVQVTGMLLGVCVLVLVLAGPRLLVAGACASLFLGLDGMFAASVSSGTSSLLASAYLMGLYLQLRRARGRDEEPRHANVMLAVWAAAGVLMRYELALAVVPAMIGWAATDWRRPRAWLPLGSALASAMLCWAIRSHYFHALPATWQPWPPSPASLQAGLRSLGDLAVRRPLVGIGVIVMLSTWVRGKFRIGRSTGFGWGLLVLAAFALLPGAGHDVERTVTILLAPAYLLAVESVWRGTRTRLGLVAALLLVGAQPARTWMARTTTPESRAGYAKLGEWLATHALPGTVVGARQVGALGYYSGLEMEDVLGQVSPRVAAARRASDGAPAAHDFAPMLRQEPDLVLTAHDEPVPSGILYVPNLDAVPPALRSDYGVYRWAGSPVWRTPTVATAAAPAAGRTPSTSAPPVH